MKDSRFKGKPQGIILDRDGVINEIVCTAGKISSPHSFAEFVIRNDFAAFCDRLSCTPISIFVASNQPDVRRGLMSEVTLSMMTKRLYDDFPIVKDVRYCMHDDSDACGCRKPKPGLLNALIEEYKLSKECTIFVGDSHKDILAGKAAGLKTAFLRKYYNENSLRLCQPDIIVSDLMELVPIITNKEGTPA